ncbi:hypothetical protein ABZW50_30505 [Streptomyces bacillaris]
MITIADHTLSRLVEQARPHMGAGYEPEAVQALNLDHDGQYLYAMATNRYTLAVSRTRITESTGEPWSAAISRVQVPELKAAIRLLDQKPITLEHTGGQLILSGESGTRIALDVLPADKGPLDWRKLLLPALEKKAAATRMSMSPKYFGAWKNLPGPVEMWSTGENKMALIVAADFLGAQMPVRREGEDATLRRELDSWKPATPALAAAA